MKKKNVKDIVILGTVVLLCSLSFAQGITPQSINCNGTKLIQSNGSLNYIVGELIVLSLTDNQGNTLNSGFASNATLTTLSIQETDASLLELEVFPNPTNELLNIKIVHSTIDYVSITITDLLGNAIYNGKYAGVSNIIGINTTSYATGTYILTLENKNNQLLGVYQIIKL